ncbi:MAG: hypothetical protein HC890_16895, partial [Chloroflexaceae bacterium]|nr:hypothetical protein [Chloroflexaceae bacterium]
MIGQFLGNIFSGFAKNFGYATSGLAIGGLQTVNAGRQLEYNKQRDAASFKLATARLQWEELSRRKSLDFQCEQNELNRRLSAEMAWTNQLLTEKEGILNRELQEKWKRIDHDFRANEGQLTRENAIQLANFHRETLICLHEKQKELQLELKRIDFQIALEIELLRRETSLATIVEQRRANNWPLTLDQGQLLVQSDSTSLLPLRILISPPVLRHDPMGIPESARSFPEIETSLKTKLREFVQQFEQRQRPIAFLPGAWISKKFHGEAVFLNIFQGLSTEPTLIIDASLERGRYFLDYCFWAIGWSKPNTGTAFTDSWREALFGMTKARLQVWKARRDAYEAREGNTTGFDQVFGTKLVEKSLADLQIIERERQAYAIGEDPSQLPGRDYTILEADTEAFCDYIRCSIVVGGMAADEYFL